MKKFITVAEMRNLEKEVLRGEISYSRMIEILCEKAEQWNKNMLAVPASDKLDNIYLFKVADYTTELLGRFEDGKYFVQRGDGTKYEYDEDRIVWKHKLNLQYEVPKSNTQEFKKVLIDTKIAVKESAKSIAQARKNAFIDLALKYKNEYESTPWWKFAKRSEAKRNWHSTREYMLKL